MLTTSFWKGAGERAIKTAAQSLLAVLGVTGLGFGDVDWAASLSVAGVAALASILTSIVNPSFTAGDTGAGETYDPDAELIGVDGDGQDEFPAIEDPETTETEADREPDDTPVDADYVPRHSA